MTLLGKTWLVFILGTSPIWVTFFMSDNDIYSLARTLPRSVVEVWLWETYLAKPWSWALSALLMAQFHYMRFVVAPWHGAEHMAIAAYDRTRCSGLEEIARESPINKYCGGRFVLPLFCLLVIALFFSSHAWYYSPTIMIVGLECVLRIDKHIRRFGEIWGFRHASEWLQRSVTTASPRFVELLTAQRALQELVAAHEAEDQAK